MKSFFLFAFFGLFSLSVMAQATFQTNKFGQDRTGVIYNKEVSVDTRLHTNGFSLGMNFGKIKTYYLTNYYHVDLGRLKHIKEFRQQSFESSGFAGFGNYGSFVFGKQNDFFALRVGWGQKRYYSEKAKIRGLAVGYSYEVGPTLGILKPYYLDLKYRIDNGIDFDTRSEKYSDANKDVFLNQLSIKGPTGFQKGLKEISLIPGGHAQIAAHFDWGAFDKIIKVLEVGLMLDLYYKSVPIMVEVDNVENKPYFLNLFINLQFGKRS